MLVQQYFVVCRVVSLLSRERLSGASEATVLKDEPVCLLCQESCRDQWRNDTIHVEWRDLHCISDVLTFPKPFLCHIAYFTGFDVLLLLIEYVDGNVVALRTSHYTE
jgi:hypothetical protein